LGLLIFAGWWKPNELDFVKIVITSLQETTNSLALIPEMTERQRGEWIASSEKLSHIFLPSRQQQFSKILFLKVLITR
jgi:hypothetical protein